MNGFKDILVCVSSLRTAQSVLETALLAAKRFYGHLDVLHIHPAVLCIVPVPVVSADMSGVVISGVVEAEEKVYNEHADEVRKLYADFVEEHGLLSRTEAKACLKEVTTRFREISGCEDEVTAWCSRVSDLTVLARPEQSSPLAEEEYAVLNAALTQSASAVLIAPRQKPDTLGKRVMIAWDATAETAKAVTLALPFLALAEEIVILETELPNEDWADVQALVQRLAWHGIRSETVKMPDTLTVTGKGEEIVRQSCGRFDLLVTGAFTQSAIRRRLSGDMTKYLIENADIPLFMAR